jgi:formylglycine-generating enzyme required for sulfatase activity
MPYTYPGGAIFDSLEYDLAPELSVQRGGATPPLPKAYSLKQYAPVPRQQSGNSCVAWASTYAARTILESVALNRTDLTLTTKNAFSADFLYELILEMEGSGDNGAQIVTAMELLFIFGPIRYSEYTMAVMSDSSPDLRAIKKYPVAGFATLFRTTNTKIEYRLERIKRSLCNGNPVIIGMHSPESFSRAKAVWQPASLDEPNAQENTRHAVCVVGYDDEKYGGAFEIMNSWGETWGDNGFTWIDYETFGAWVLQAWVLTDDESLFESAVEYTEQIDLTVEGRADPLPVKLLEDGVYQTHSSLPAGTRLRVTPKNSGEVKSYVFALDSVAKTLGPVDQLIETSANTTDFAVLLTRRELDIGAISSAFLKQTGTLHERLRQAVGSDFIPYANSKYEYDSMRVTTYMLDEQAVTGMILHTVPADMIKINGGSFMMGSPAKERGHQPEEAGHKVDVKSFYIGASEVTVGEFREFISDRKDYLTTAEQSGASIVIIQDEEGVAMRSGFNWRNPAFIQEDTYPVVCVSWFDAIEYCNWRSQKEGLTPVYTIKGNSTTQNLSANGYRLPTEEEWEYVCRAGTSTSYSTGNNLSYRDANYGGSFIFKTTPVRDYKPNVWGIYAMHGNVMEWCSDGPMPGIRFIRGGAWFLGLDESRSASRSAGMTDATMSGLGFRLARSDN